MREPTPEGQKAAWLRDYEAPAGLAVAEDAPAKVTKAALVLEAARGLPQPFSLPQLVLAAWQHDKAAFGLKDFAQLHPSDNAVLTYVHGARGLVARGLLRKVAGGYAVAGEGAP